MIGQDTLTTVFHSPEWVDLIARTYHYRAFILADIDPQGQLLAGIPMIEKTSVFGNKSWISLPFTDHCAPLSISHEHEILFTRKLVELLHQRSNLRMELRWQYKDNGELQTKQDFVLHNLSLSPDFSSTAKRIHPMHCRNARNATKRGVTIDTGVGVEHLAQFYRLHLITRRRMGVPIQPKLFFTNLANNLLNGTQGFIMCAYIDSLCVASAIFLFANKTMTYKYGASDPKYTQMRPNDLIFWNAIQWGCENGYTNIDFGRTEIGNSGLRSYKSRWGAIEKDLVYSYGPTSPKNRSAWINNVLSTVIRHSPKWMCQLSGELLYRIAG